MIIDNIGTCVAWTFTFYYFKSSTFDYTYILKKKNE